MNNKVLAAVAVVSALGLASLTPVPSQARMGGGMHGMHGGFGRESTYNFMAAIGPDFKKSFVDESPAGNTDIAPTLARILHLNLASNGTLKGRVLQESLAGGPASISHQPKVAVSEPAANGKRTILLYQQAGDRVYFDRACLATAPESSTARLQNSCP